MSRYSLARESALDFLNSVQEIAFVTPAINFRYRILFLLNIAER
jgi:hypothetical protein